MKLDPVLKLLFIGMLTFTGLLFASEVWFKDDSQLFQVMAGVLTAFTGAFFGRMDPKKAGVTSDQPPITSSEVRTTTIRDSEPPSEPK